MIGVAVLAALGCLLPAAAIADSTELAEGPRGQAQAGVRSLFEDISEAEE
jgi:hypothetical protein